MSEATSSKTQNRKMEHITALAQDLKIERKSSFDKIILSHRALPEINFSEVSSKTKFLNKTISSPLLISSMTGGCDTQLITINRHLAQAAEKQQIALAVGSQRVMINDAKAEASFKLRQYAPTIPLIANIGAVQLNYGFGVEQARKAVDILEADALYLHLNPLQEVIQPEGDTNFSNLAHKIEKLAKQLEVPIILKEVGCGFSTQDMQTALDAGITWVDVSGHGGTSWSRIEANRCQDLSLQQDMGVLFQDWGISSLESLKLAKQFQSKLKFIASGGIRNGIDMVKSVIMGGSLCGVAAPFLQPAQLSAQAVEDKIIYFTTAFKISQFLLGAHSIDDLFLNETLLETTA